jgi:hypothetical protein
MAVGQARFMPAEGWQMDVSRSRAGRSLMLFKGAHKFLVTTGASGQAGPTGPWCGSSGSWSAGRA